MQIGWTGVDLFFVLSGFLVSGLLFTEYQERGSLDIVRFLIRRGFKIYPGFYFMMGVTVVVAVMAGVFEAAMIPRIVAESFYVQNNAQGGVQPHLVLAIEPYLGRIIASPTASTDSAFLAMTGAYLVAAILVGVLVGKLIEQPAVTFRDRLFPTRAGRRPSPGVLQSAT